MATLGGMPTLRFCFEVVTGLAHSVSKSYLYICETLYLSYNFFIKPVCSVGAVMHYSISYSNYSGEHKNLLIEVYSKVYNQRKLSYLYFMLNFVKIILL